MTASRTLAAFVRADDAGTRWLEGFRCSACGEVVLETRAACPKCAAVRSLEPHRLQPTGRLHAYTIVHRSFAGIATPFVSAIVELDGGGFVRGNITGIAPDPVLLTPGLRLRVVFDEVAVESAPGERFVRHVFVPEETPAGAGAAA